jgi:DnaJ-class molecular chaperone
MSEQNCHYCEGKGYLEIRDCSGEIQREETCSFCDGRGTVEREQSDRDSLDLQQFSIR